MRGKSISYKYNALVEEKGYGFSKKNGAEASLSNGRVQGLEQPLTPWQVAPKIYVFDGQHK